ncbi:unnamed protein product, partial [Heterotrigona itama]
KSYKTLRRVVSVTSAVKVLLRLGKSINCQNLFGRRLSVKKKQLIRCDDLIPRRDGHQELEELLLRFFLRSSADRDEDVAGRWTRILLALCGRVLRNSSVTRQETEKIAFDDRAHGNSNTDLRTFYVLRVLLEPERVVTDDKAAIRQKKRRVNQ